MKVNDRQPRTCKVCRRDLPSDHKHYCSMRCRRTEERHRSCTVCLKPLARNRFGHYRKTCSDECATTAHLRFRGRWNATRNYRLHGWHENRAASTNQHSEELSPQYRYVATREIGTEVPQVIGRFQILSPENGRSVRFRIGNTLYGEGPTQGSAIWAVYNCPDSDALLLPDSTHIYAPRRQDNYEPAPPNPYEKVARPKLQPKHKRSDQHV